MAIMYIIRLHVTVKKLIRNILYLKCKKNMRPSVSFSLSLDTFFSNKTISGSQDNDLLLLK